MEKPTEQDSAATLEFTGAFAWIETHFAWLAPAVFLVLTAIVFGDILLSDGKVVGVGDMQAFTVPYFEFLDREFHQGNVPTWNPHYFGGSPLAGNINAGIFYPLSWFHYFMPLVRAINVMTALHVFLAGWFLALWCRHRKVGALSCIFGGLVFMLSGPYFAHVYPGHPAVMAASAYVPLVFLSLDGLWDATRWQGRLGWILLGTLGLGLQVLTGFAQLVYYTALMAAAYSLLRFVTSARPMRSRTIGLLLCGALYLGGPALGAIALLPGLAMTRESVRSNGVNEQFAGSCSLPPEMLISALAPHFWGDNQGANRYLGREVFWSLSLFTGCSTLLLALYGAIASDWRKRQFAGTLLLIALILAMGRHIPPLFHFLYNFLPGYASLRTSSRWNEFIALFMAMLAALGLDRLLHKKRSPVWLAVGGGVAAIVMFGLSYQLQASVADAHGVWAGMLEWLASLGKVLPALDNAHDRAAFVRDTGVYAGRQLLWAALTLLATAIAIALGRLSPKWTSLIVLIAAVELLVYARHTRASASPIQPYPDFWTEARRKIQHDDTRVYNSELELANLGMLAEYNDIFGYDPVCTLRYAQFIQYLGQRDPGQTDFPMAANVLQPDAAGSRQLGSLSFKVRTNTPVGIPYLHTRRPINALPFLQMLRCALVMEQTPSGRLPATRVVDPMPHLCLIRKWTVIGNLSERLAALTSVDFDPRRQVILESAPAIGGVPEPGIVDGESARVIRSSTDWLEIEAETAGAILLVTDGYANGWNVRPIGIAPQPQYQVMPANQILRAIPLQAGHHHFRLEYSAPGYAAGKIISGIALLAWLVGGGALLVLRRRSAQPTSQSVR